MYNKHDSHNPFRGPYDVGTRVFIVEDIRTFDTKWLKSKSRFTKNKFVKVKYFAGWTNLLKDGQIIKTMDGIRMNRRTYIKFENKLKDEYRREVY